MRVTCPHCGERDRREFTYQGDALALFRPEPDAGPAVWDDYLHNRGNQPGRVRDLWYHDPCGTWVVVERDTETHEVFGSEAAAEVAR